MRGDRSEDVVGPALVHSRDPSRVRVRRQERANGRLGRCTGCTRGCTGTVRVSGMAMGTVTVPISTCISTLRMRAPVHMGTTAEIKVMDMDMGTDMDMGIATVCPRWGPRTECPSPAVVQVQGTTRIREVWVGIRPCIRILLGMERGRRRQCRLGLDMRRGRLVGMGRDQGKHKGRLVGTGSIPGLIRRREGMGMALDLDLELGKGMDRDSQGMGIRRVSRFSGSCDGV